MGQSANDEALRGLADCEYLERIHAFPSHEMGNFHKGIDQRPGFTAAGIQHLNGLKRPKGISVMDGQIDDAFLEAVSKIESIERLVCHSVRVTDRGIRSLERCSNLRLLMLQDIVNPFPPTALDRFESLSKLKTLGLYGNLPAQSLEAIERLKQKLPNANINARQMAAGAGLRQEQLLRWLSQYHENPSNGDTLIAAVFTNATDFENAMTDLPRFFIGFMTSEERNQFIAYVRTQKGQITVDEAANMAVKVRWEPENGKTSLTQEN
jgi:hypothetical protein